MFTEAELANLKELAALSPASLSRLAALPSASLSKLAALPSAEIGRLMKLAALPSAEIGRLVKLAALPSAEIGRLVKLAALPSAEIGRLVKLAGDFSVRELNRLNSLVVFMIAEGLTGEETGRPALWYDASATSSESHGPARMSLRRKWLRTSPAGEASARELAVRPDG